MRDATALKGAPVRIREAIVQNTSTALAGCYTQSLAGLAYGHLTKGIATIGSRFRLNTWKRQGIVSAFTPRQLARLQDMFDSADEFLAEFRVSEAADRIAV